MTPKSKASKSKASAKRRGLAIGIARPHWCQYAGRVVDACYDCTDVPRKMPKYVGWYVSPMGRVLFADFTSKARAHRWSGGTARVGRIVWEPRRKP